MKMTPEKFRAMSPDERFDFWTNVANSKATNREIAKQIGWSLQGTAEQRRCARRYIDATAERAELQKQIDVIAGAIKSIKKRLTPKKGRKS